ncbi:DUF2267 domain-containing protein [Allorhizocola rhizosphaerae]|uniref:DUF2267 domain-containing protein n=1 Tax=Allorhizocola rhizosphaerae TaxID=1872709 RepID=UPI000E3DE0EA|nr:DUF2267 domain-containing protein [Allorhizocola rhizosphaerae]
MKYDDFLGQVQNRARLADLGQAERATRAVLETLGQRIPDGLAGNLAAQLPHEVGEHLRRYQMFGELGTGEHFDLDEFVRRVSERSGLDGPQAAFVVRAVCEVVDEATQGSVWQKVSETLPSDLRTLVTAGSAGDVNIKRR